MKQLAIHTLLHVPYESLGCIENWVINNNHKLSYSKFFETFTLPNPADIDMLIIMGGPMSVYEEAEYPWLQIEKSFIKTLISQGKIVLGICLGSQLIAEVLGAKVYPNAQKEIGWFNVYQTELGKSTAILSELEQAFKVFHWHGDTYDLPENCSHLFYSDICKHQAFLYNNRVLGLQFHFEATEKSIIPMLEEGKTELIESATIQTAEEILEQKINIANNNQRMYQILDEITK